VIDLNFTMKDVASWALNTAALRGATYADARIVDERSRALATKNGKIGGASDDLSRAAVEATSARAVEIAKASARVKVRDVQLVPEKPVTAEWTTPHTIDPFTTSIEQNLNLLMRIDAELRSVAGVTLAETNMNFRREEQWFVSS